MTKKALRKDLLREIWNTRARFLSILLLVALAVAFLAGLRTTEPDMTTTADVYLDDTGLMDVRVLSTLGLTDDDYEAVLDLPGVENAQKGWQIDALVSAGETTVVVKTISMPDQGINEPYMKEGRLPENASECIVSQSVLDGLEKEIGDTLTLDTGDGTYEDALSQDTFTVVGVCTSPLYISRQYGSSSLGSGTITGFVYLPGEVYDLDYYTDIFVTLNGAKALNAYSDEYTALVDDFTDANEDFADQRAQLRTAQVKDEALETLDDAQQEYDDAKAEADEKLSDAEEELTDARSELDDGWQEYYDGVDTLDSETASAEEQLKTARAQLASAKSTLDDGEAQYADGKSQLEEGISSYENGLTQYESGLDAYNEGEAQYEAALTQYNEGEAQYEAGRAQYEAGKTQYEAGLSDYNEGLAQYEAGLAQYEAGRSEYESAMSAYEENLSSWQVAWDQITQADMEDSEQGQQLQAQKAALDQAGAQLDQTKAALDATENTLAEKKAELDAAEAVLDSTKDQLAASKSQLDTSRAQLDTAKQQLEATEQQLAEAKTQLSDSQSQLADAKRTIDASSQTLSASRQQLDDGWDEYNEGLAEAAEGEKTLQQKKAEGQETLDEALQELKDGEAEYADGLQEYEDAKAEADEKLAEAADKISDGQQEIDDISDAKWYLLDRDTNLGFAGYKNNAENMGNLATMFPLIFFLVAALVCLTTMTRMVEEQRVTIGGLKALGYSKFDIAGKYVGYGLAASAIGSILGLALGCTLIPYIIITCWKIMYSIPSVQFEICPGIYLMSAGTAVAVIVLTVLSAVLSALRETPATLMRPKTPKAGKRVFMERIPAIWNRLSFTQKVTVRNLFRYKKRFFMTIIGIGGCTALLVTGFGLRDSINDILDIQYDQLSLYDSTAAVTEENLEEAEQILADQSLVADYTAVSQSSIDFEGSSTISGYYMVVDDPESVDGFLVFRKRLGHDPVQLTDDGLLVSEKLSELMDLKVGDSLVLNGDERVTATVAGIVENRVFNYVYMTQAYYEKLYGQKAEHNELMIQLKEATHENEDAVASALLDAGVVSSVSNISETRENLDQSFSSINYAVLVIIVSAAALAFVVLFNLSNINITERKRELATLKVLGFNDQEMSAYVLRENVVLTVIGTFIGLFMGKGLHAFLVKTVEIEMVMFGRSAKPVSYVYAVILTIVFSIAVNIITGQKLKKIDMVESLKSVE